MAKLLIEVTDAERDNKEMLILMVETDEGIQPDHLATKIESAIYRIDFYSHKRGIEKLFPDPKEG